MTPDPTRPPDEHTAFQTEIDALCQQLPAERFDAAQHLAAQEREPG